jgi:hypothetical protein
MLAVIMLLIFLSLLQIIINLVNYSECVWPDLNVNSVALKSWMLFFAHLMKCIVID